MYMVMNASELVLEVYHPTGHERHKLKESGISLPDTFYCA